MGTGTRPVHREAVVWASRTLRVGVGCGPDVWLQALFSAGVMTVGTACLWREPGAAQLSRYGRGGKGGRLDLTPPHQGNPVPKQPLPHIALKTWKVWGLKDMQKTTFCKVTILLLKNEKD